MFVESSVNLYDKLRKYAKKFSALSKSWEDKKIATETQKRMG